ncbi:MAG: hypothetical protein ABIS50_15935 [Luteolibacter sp.]|uniref:hypothetical protein n=1 Tax=Luteolibacter sp. TaxID=1962973 RepID=UPI003265F1D3
MTDPEVNVYQALQRVETFVIPHTAAFPAGSEGAKDVARVTPLIQEIGPPKQISGRPASPATGAKASLFDEVRDDLEAIAATARTIAKKDPGFDTPYRLGDDTQRQILADAERILGELATPATVARFIAYAMEPNFVTDLQADLALIDGKGEEQEEDQIDSVGDTARVAVLIKEARALITSIGTSVKNKFRRDPEILAEWATASHIQRTPRKKPGDATPEPLPAV